MPSCCLGQSLLELLVGAKVAASDAVRPLQQGQLHHCALAARAQSLHSCTIVLTCCQCCLLQKV